MRQLTASQKKFLDEKIVEYREQSGILLNDVDKLTFLDWETLEKMHDTEILWQEANRYLNDKCLEAIHG